MSRLPRITTGGGHVAERIRLRRGGSLRPVDEMLLHSEPVADGWNQLLGAVRDQTTLSRDVSELVVMRVAALTGADYEWQAHRDAAAAAACRLPRPRHCAAAMRRTAGSTSSSVPCWL